MKRFFSILTTAGLLTAGAQAAIIFTAEAPGVQTSVLCPATFATCLVETFDPGDGGLAPGSDLNGYVSSATGLTYTGDGIFLSGNPADYPPPPGTPDDYRFGGANATNYVSVGVQDGSNTGSYEIDFAGDAFYFGFFWGAGDNRNKLTFYDGATEVGTFLVGDIIASLLPGHYGNPNGGYNSAEPYAFLNFTATLGVKFTRVVVSNDNPSSGPQSGFETDNHTISRVPIDIVPEPATFGLAGMALLALGMKLRKRS